MKNSIAIFIISFISINIIYLSPVNAAIGQLELRQIYALGGLALISLGLIFYLFDVIFRPERY